MEKSCERRKEVLKVLSGEEIEKWGITWHNIGGLYFPKEPLKCGIFCGITKDELDNPKLLMQISSVKEYWEQWI